MALDASFSSFLTIAQQHVRATGLASGYVKSVSRIVCDKADQRTFGTLDFVTISSAHDPEQHAELFCQTTWLSACGKAIFSVSSTRSAWWRQVRRKLRCDSLEQHLTVYSCSEPCKPAVRFCPDVATHLVEKLDFAEIVGEPREPQGDNPSWYHIAQARTRRLGRLAEDFECAQLENSLLQWRARKSMDKQGSHHQTKEEEDLQVFQPWWAQGLDGCCVMIGDGSYESASDWSFDDDWSEDDEAFEDVTVPCDDTGGVSTCVSGTVFHSMCNALTDPHSQAQSTVN